MKRVRTPKDGTQKTLVVLFPGGIDSRHQLNSAVQHAILQVSWPKAMMENESLEQYEQTHMGSKADFVQNSVSL